MKQQVKNGNYVNKYFTQIPNIIDDSGLDPYELRLLYHYYRVGECWEGVRTTAEKCKMSVGKVSAVRKTLEEKGFIKIAPLGFDGVTITVQDKSKENTEKYSSPDEHPVHVENMKRSYNALKSSLHEHKNNQLRITNEEEVLPYSELFRIAWQHWLAYKKQRKEKFPDTTRDLQLKKLAGFRDEQVAVDSLNKSMENGWQGLFDPREKRNGANKQQTSNGGFVE